ncbi:acyl-CoA dehydrogenase [Bradyrhizobium sp. 2TAF24]|uniref:acyl-CoA dehydrogenase n=1 Tax=Bradyrhizobium sp. 2TAF24 TaxID=3233011 RepID=UPI003F92F089
MSSYTPPLPQQLFLLERVLGLQDILDRRADGADLDTCRAVLEGASRFASGILAPLNAVGDRVGASFSAGHVTMPPGFAAAYDAFVRQGWSALSAPRELGGQGLPQLLQLAVSEMVIGGCMAFAMLPLQQRAATKLLAMHGQGEASRRLLPDLVAGRCGATIAMTEADAGSDAGRGRTRAVPRGDGLYELHGSKMFISYGDHDLTRQIAHIVLAREADAGDGGRGMGLFLVRKWLDDDYRIRNAAHVTAIEHKMGLKASPTCVLTLDGAVGERIGPAGAGLRLIFTMINVMRLEVSLHGVAIGQAAYGRARAYADERRQGSDAAGHGPVALIDHADVRRNLVTMRARLDATRALVFEAARQFDLAELAGPDEAANARALAEFLLPVCKVAGSEAGFDIANLAVQVFGGHGYVTDNGVEQYVRDVRVAAIFEGANGIQAIDLLTRKLVDHDGLRWQAFIRRVRADVGALAGRRRAPEFAIALNALEDLAVAMRSRLERDRDLALAGATPFLNMVAIIALGWMWLRLDAAGIGEVEPDPRLPDVCDYFFTNLFPLHEIYRRQAFDQAPWRRA